MKRYDGILAALSLTYLVIAILLYLIGQDREVTEHVAYKVEINQIMRGLEEAGAFSEPDLRGREWVRGVFFLPEQVQSEQEIRDFYQNHNGVNSAVYPLYAGGGRAGYVRFDYVAGAQDRAGLWAAWGVLFFSWLAVSGVLMYVRQKIIRPFHVISRMPYELAKGNLQTEPEESKSRFFGKFVWGLSMLKDTLALSRQKTLELEREKKMLLLSLSHDIKMPLSAIRLYAKALREGVYGTREENMRAVSQIEKHARQIEVFVREIVDTAREDILEIEVADDEFYLADYVDKVRAHYEPKCRLVMTEFAVERYENKLLKGDMNRAFEVMENLLENAMKYGDGRKIRIGFYEEDYCQVIEVCNTGAPVEERELPHLFDSFYRGSNAKDRGGNGLGLYISRQIMRKMEGDIFAGRAEDGMRFGIVFRM